MAMALDAGVASMRDSYDATKPIRIAHYTIRDFHAKKRWLSVPEIFMYSSNIGAAKMAMDVGTEGQRAFLDRIGLLDPSPLEMTQVGTPLVTVVWRPTNNMSTRRSVASGKSG